MEDGPAAADGLAHTVGAPEVADDLLHVEPFEVGGVGTGLDERDHLLLPADQVTSHRGTDEPARPGHEDPVT